MMEGEALKIAVEAAVVDKSDADEDDVVVVVVVVVDCDVAEDAVDVTAPVAADSKLMSSTSSSMNASLKLACCVSTRLN